MNNITKQAICNSFMQLLNEKPLKKITVLDIVNGCGLNRNTFYYHFKDMPELIKFILVEEWENCVIKSSHLDSLEECINIITDFITKNKNAVLHIYKSVNREIFEQYQWEICNFAVNAFLDNKLKDVKISDDDRNVIETYLKGTFFGMIMEWLNCNLGYDIQKIFQRLCKLKHGDLDDLIEKCREM